MVEEQEKEVGMGAKIVFGAIMVVATAFYYFIALNWVLMEPIQNLPYPY